MFSQNVCRLIDAKIALFEAERLLQQVSSYGQSDQQEQLKSCICNLRQVVDAATLALDATYYQKGKQ
jgi:hypothetical protein